MDVRKTVGVRYQFEGGKRLDLSIDEIIDGQDVRVLVDDFEKQGYALKERREGIIIDDGDGRAFIPLNM